MWPWRFGWFGTPLPVVLGAARPFWLLAFPMLGHSGTRLLWLSSYSRFFCLFAQSRGSVPRLGPLDSASSGSAPLDRTSRIGSSRLGPPWLGPAARHPLAWPPSARSTRLGPLGSNPSALVLGARLLLALPSARWLKSSATPARAARRSPTSSRSGAHPLRRSAALVNLTLSSATLVFSGARPLRRSSSPALGLSCAGPFSPSTYP